MEERISHPIILSASRTTDIPAFYMDSFITDLYKGYISRTNRYSGVVTKLMLDLVSFIVFWTKNPINLFKYISEFKSRGIDFYVQYTMNDYDAERFEPGVPSITSRIETFKTLSKTIGKERVIWRFDPLILTDTLTVDVLISKIINIANQISGYTDKLVFSFVDISDYNKVAENLKRHNINYILWTEELMKEFASKLAEANRNYGWNLELATCAERIDLTGYGIKKNKCIDDDLILKLAYNNKRITDYLSVDIQPVSYNLFGESNIPENAVEVAPGLVAVKRKKLKDAGQRPLCGCCMSQEIGSYERCFHGCVYCYANGANY